jgi:hypothetical protein
MMWSGLQQDEKVGLNSRREVNEGRCGSTLVVARLGQYNGGSWLREHAGAGY